MQNYSKINSLYPLWLVNPQICLQVKFDFPFVPAMPSTNNTDMPGIAKSWHICHQWVHHHHRLNLFYSASGTAIFLTPHVSIWHHFLTIPKGYEVKKAARWKSIFLGLSQLFCCHWFSKSSVTHLPHNHHIHHIIINPTSTYTPAIHPSIKNTEQCLY